MTSRISQRNNTAGDTSMRLAQQPTLDIALANKRTSKSSASGRGSNAGQQKVLPDLPKTRAKLSQRGLEILTDRQRHELSEDLDKLAKQRRDAEADSANLRFSS